MQTVISNFSLCTHVSLSRRICRSYDINESSVCTISTINCMPDGHLVAFASFCFFFYCYCTSINFVLKSRWLARKLMALQVPLSRVGQATNKLVFLQTGMQQLIWITLTKRCSILCHPTLDLESILVLSKGQLLLSQTISGMGSMLEQTQVASYIVFTLLTKVCFCTCHF